MRVLCDIAQIFDVILFCQIWELRVSNYHPENNRAGLRVIDRLLILIFFLAWKLVPFEKIKQERERRI